MVNLIKESRDQETLYQGLDSALESGNLREIYLSLQTLAKTNYAGLESVARDLMLYDQKMDRTLNNGATNLSDDDKRVYNLIGAALIAYSNIAVPSLVNQAAKIAYGVLNSAVDKDTKYLAALALDYMAKNKGITGCQASGLMSMSYGKSSGIEDLVA